MSDTIYIFTVAKIKISWNKILLEALKSNMLVRYDAQNISGHFTGYVDADNVTFCADVTLFTARDIWLTKSTDGFFCRRLLLISSLK